MYVIFKDRSNGFFTNKLNTDLLSNMLLYE